VCVSLAAWCYKKEKYKQYSWWNSLSNKSCGPRSEESCSIKYLGMQQLKIGKAIHYCWESRNKKYLGSNSFNKLSSGMEQLLMIGNARSIKNM
jgi:hypothetical protein